MITNPLLMLLTPQILYSINKSVRRNFVDLEQIKKVLSFLFILFLIIHTQFKRYLSDLYPSILYLSFLVKYSVLASHAIFFSLFDFCKILTKVLFKTDRDTCYIFVKEAKRVWLLIFLCWDGTLLGISI